MGYAIAVCDSIFYILESRIPGESFHLIACVMQQQLLMQHT